MSSDFENKYLDVLQNIEFGLLSGTKDNHQLCDHDILRVIEHAIAYYKFREKHKDRKLPENLQNIFEQVTSVCDWRLGLKPISEDKDLHCNPISIEEIILCLKRIEKSIKFWTKQGGRFGYITFASDSALV